MSRTLTRWYPILLMRNALGRFMALRILSPSNPPRRRTTPPANAAIQLILFRSRTFRDTKP
jgi:hypothetical protein